MGEVCPKVLLALTTSKKLYARFLRWLMGAEYHHTLLFVNLRALGGWVAIDVDKNGPHIVSVKRAFRNISKFECYYSAYNLFDGISACRDYLGEGYDRLGVLSGIWKLLLRKYFNVHARS